MICSKHQGIHFCGAQINSNYIPVFLSDYHKLQTSCECLSELANKFDSIVYAVRTRFAVGIDMSSYL